MSFKSERKEIPTKNNVVIQDDADLQDFDTGTIDLIISPDRIDMVYSEKIVEDLFMEM